MSYSIFHETIAGMSWPKIDKPIKNEAVALLPTGAIKEHGPNMSL